MYRTHTGNEGNRNEGGDLLYGLIVQRAVRQSAVTAGLAAVKVPITPLRYRKSLQIFNNAANVVYLGDASVTAADGYPLYPRASINIQIEDGIDVYAISAIAGQELRIIEGA